MSLNDNKVLSAKAAELVQNTASTDLVQRAQAVTEFFSAIQLPIRQGIMDGDNTSNICNVSTLAPGVTPEFPIDPIRPGTENEFRAFTNPGKGRIPQHTMTGDTIILPTIGNTNAVDWHLKFARNARWDVISRLIEGMMGGFVKKRNDDVWHTILAAAADRGMVVYDAGANVGQFTKLLFSLVRCAMARNSGGNQSSIKRGRVTDMYLSCEGFEEILNWSLDQVPDAVRAQLYSMSSGDNTISDILGVKMHQMYELGVGQEYQLYYTNTLGGALSPSGGAHAANDVELAIGLDLVNRDSFIMAITQALEIFEDPMLHRSQKGGFYGWEEYGVAVMDNRRVIAMSY